MSISSDEIAYLIQRYFHECDFEHSYFTFNAESQIDMSSINGAQIPPGALITLLQKGVLYIQLENEINSANKGVTWFSGSQLSLIDAALREGAVLPPKPDKPAPPVNNAPSIQLNQSNAIPLAEHHGDALCCTWSSDGRYLASGARDATAIVWDMSNPHDIAHVVLQHTGDGIPGQRQISTLDWSPANMLVTGCNDGSCHVWDTTGVESVSVSDGSQPGAIHVVRFSPSGEKFVAGGADSVAVVRTIEGQVVRREDVKHSAIMDAAWRNDDCFAVCCEDGTVAVFTGEEDTKWLNGHEGAVNGVAWSNSGEFLASCGNDNTVRLWEGEQVYVLRGHSDVVYAVRWSSNDVLASSCFDNTVRIWDVQNRACVHVLVGHEMSIYALCFSPNGQMLVSGSFDQTVKFWRVSDGQLLATCVGSQRIFDLQADAEGNYVAVCFDGGNIFVIPTANLPLQSDA